MKTSSTPLPGHRPGRHLQLPDDPHHDAYFHQGKPAAPAVCQHCHAVFQHGHWAWGQAPHGAADALCPACQRIREQQPGGYVTLEAALTAREQDELVRLLRNVEHRETVDHAMERIIDMTAAPGKLLVTTTSPHLAQTLAAAVERAMGGQAEYAFSRDEHLLRVCWRRE